ncbi:hypothetical protein DL98DRAFT_530328 [Cadophora sp. DSE1049]|nr:hypothetical protein DL98DRAFT_530328 [Cadophora sp. DSE1049]
MNVLSSVLISALPCHTQSTQDPSRPKPRESSQGTVLKEQRVNQGITFKSRKGWIEGEERQEEQEEPTIHPLGQTAKGYTPEHITHVRLDEQIASSQELDNPELQEGA